MAKIGRRGRATLRKVKPASTRATGFAGKPAKSSVSGNYGQAVSAAAHARNAARQAAKPAGMMSPGTPKPSVKKPPELGVAGSGLNRVSPGNGTSLQPERLRAAARSSRMR